MTRRAADHEQRHDDPGKDDRRVEHDRPVLPKNDLVRRDLHRHNPSCPLRVRSDDRHLHPLLDSEAHDHEAGKAHKKPLPPSVHHEIETAERQAEPRHGGGDDPQRRLARVAQALDGEPQHRAIGGPEAEACREGIERTGKINVHRQPTSSVRRKAPATAVRGHAAAAERSVMRALPLYPEPCVQTSQREPDEQECQRP